jgi:hypothetical protein
MTEVVIYNQNNGVPAVIFPTANALRNKTINQIAEKGVPTDVPYWIVNLEDLPEEQQESWELVNMPAPDGVGQ